MPAKLDRPEPGLLLFGLLLVLTSHYTPAGRGSKQHQTAYALRMTDGIGHGHSCTLTHCYQGKPVDVGSLDDGFEVFNVAVRREFDPLTIGQAASAPVVVDQRVMTGQQGEPRAPDRTVPVKSQMMDPMRCPDERRSLSASRVSDPRAIIARAEADLLRGFGHAVQEKAQRLILACSFVNGEPFGALKVPSVWFDTAGNDYLAPAIGLLSQEDGCFGRGRSSWCNGKITEALGNVRQLQGLGNGSR